MKKTIIISIFLLFCLSRIGALQAGEASGSAKSPSPNDPSKIEKRPAGLGLALGLSSTYFRMTDPQRFKGLNRVEEQQDYTPSQITLNYALGQWKAPGQTFQFNLDGEAFLKPLTALPKNEGLSWGDGELEWTPYILSLQMRVPNKTGFLPYLSLGVAYIRTNFNTYSWYANGYPDPNSTAQARGKKRFFHMEPNTWGWSLGAGTDYFITRNWALNLDIKYLLASASFDWGVTVNGALLDQGHGQFYLDSFLVGLGVKYLF
jgi:opacity protein-like surface antigen